MIRRLTRVDYTQYYNLIDQFRKTQFSEGEFKIFIDTHPSNIHIWVYVQNNMIIGTITVIYEPKLIHDMCTYAHIEDMFITENYRGKGIGSKLIQHVIDQSRHCYKVTLYCDEKVSKFYIANGLEIRGIQCCQLLKNLG